MRSKFLASLVFAVLASTFAFAFTAGAQGTRDASATATSAGGKSSDRPLLFAQGRQATRAHADTEPSGPLAGTAVDTISADADGKIEKIIILRPDCTATQGASLVVEDDDGTQGALIDDRNVRITEIPEGLKVTSNRAHPNADMKALNVRGGDKVLDNGGLTVVTSTDITCNGVNPPPVTDPPPETTIPPPETTNPPPGQVAPAPDSECPGAQVVNTTTGTGDKQSAPFQITGDRFRLTVTNNPTSSDPSLSDVTVYVADAGTKEDVTSFDKGGAGQESSIVNAGPGSFYIFTFTANADYTVTVEDCVGSETTTPPPETIIPPPETTTPPPVTIPPPTTTSPSPTSSPLPITSPPPTTTPPPGITPPPTTTSPPPTTTIPPPTTTSPPPTTTSPPPTTTPAPTTSPTPQPQDRVKGPLAGGTAIGKDVLVPGDVIDVLPDGTRVVGIDQVVIRTENCKLTAHGDGLSVTLNDQGVPGRITDGQNVDITLRPDGTLVSNGRVKLGDFFTTDPRQNPSDRVIVPIPVDPENDQFPREPNDTFPIISSTGIEGKGCHVLEPANTGNTGSNNSMDNGGNTNSRDGVIPDTSSNLPLPNTGGVPLHVAIIVGLILAGGGVLLYSKSAFQPLSTSARRRSREDGRPPTG
jgi:LPXTG-motif cell wall-anchored protein